MGWERRPVFIEHWPIDDDVTKVVFIDKNGHPDYSCVTKAMQKGNTVEIGDRFFSVTGCCIAKSSFIQVKDSIMDLKRNHWTDGMFLYSNENKRVCLHSHETRRKALFLIQ